MVINQKVANRWVARFIPLVLIAIVCYASYVVVGPVCGQYVERPFFCATFLTRTRTDIDHM